uniref:Uncharacterized protein n=1 Tax=Acrobeloides nanus TaxID=290746 RepID=A0A914DMF5_9BILA
MQTTPIFIIAIFYICDKIHAFEFDAEQGRNTYFNEFPRNVEAGRFESEYQRRGSDDSSANFLPESSGSGISQPRRLIQPPPLKRSLEIQQRSNNNAYSSAGQSSFPRRLIQPPPLKRSLGFEQHQPNQVFRWLRQYEPYYAMDY